MANLLSRVIDLYGDRPSRPRIARDSCGRRLRTLSHNIRSDSIPSRSTTAMIFSLDNRACFNQPVTVAQEGFTQWRRYASAECANRIRLNNTGGVGCRRSCTSYKRRHISICQQQRAKVTCYSRSNFARDVLVDNRNSTSIGSTSYECHSDVIPAMPTICRREEDRVCVCGQSCCQRCRRHHSALKQIANRQCMRLKPRIVLKRIDTANTSPRLNTSIRRPRESFNYITKRNEHPARWQCPRRLSHRVYSLCSYRCFECHVSPT